MCNPKPTLAQSIAEKMLQLMNAESWQRLPSMRVLSRHFHVSMTTIRLAAHILQNRHEIEICHGQGMRSAKVTSKPELPDTLSYKQSGSRLFEDLKDKILDGRYQSGKDLPKNAFHVLERGVSHHTVTAAYRRLESEGLAHKRGRTWYAGPCSESNQIINVLSNPVILLLQDRENTWSSLASRPFYESFCRSFHTEIESHGIQLIPALYDETAPSVGVITAGRTGILNLIRQLGSRYRGALVMNISADRPDFPGWLFELTGKSIPLVWFDRSKIRATLPFESKHLIRCRPSEENAVAMALQLLAGLGHQTIAYPYSSDAGWVANREELLIRKASAFGSPLSIVSTPYRRNIFLHDDESGQASLLRRWHRNGLPHVKSSIDFLLAGLPEMIEKVPAQFASAFSADKYRAVASLLHYIAVHEQEGVQVFRNIQFLPWLISLAPTLAPYVRNPKVTAILAPNDAAARMYFMWLKAAGVVVPREISLLSFDNFWVLQYWPITTIDFGFGYLGYSAFHAIMRDIPLKRNRDGDIPAQPRVIHRGTVASPRQELIKACLQGEF